jgi:hypothetical protein
VRGEAPPQRAALRAARHASGRRARGAAVERVSAHLGRVEDLEHARAVPARPRVAAESDRCPCRRATGRAAAETGRAPRSRASAPQWRARSSALRARTPRPRSRTARSPSRPCRGARQLLSGAHGHPPPAPARAMTSRSRGADERQLLTTLGASGKPRAARDCACSARASRRTPRCAAPAPRPPARRSPPAASPASPGDARAPRAGAGRARAGPPRAGAVAPAALQRDSYAACCRSACLKVYRRAEPA